MAALAASVVLAMAALSFGAIRTDPIIGSSAAEQFNNQGQGGAESHPALAPFAPGQIRKFVMQVWDADHRDPSDLDGGNQDFFIIDILHGLS